MAKIRGTVFVAAIASIRVITACSSTMNQSGSSGSGGSGAGGAGAGAGGALVDAGVDSSPDRTPGGPFPCVGDNTCQAGVSYCHAFYGHSFDGGVTYYLISATCDPLPPSCAANDCSCFPPHGEYAFECLCSAGDGGGLSVGCSTY
jgi:hypothetical protein